MNEGNRREADVGWLQMDIDRLRDATGESEVSAESNTAFLGELLQLLKSLPPVSPHNYVEHKLVCDTFMRAGGNSAVMSLDRCYVKMMSTRVALVASVDHWLTPEERNQHLVEAEEHLSGVRQLFEMGGCEELSQEFELLERLTSGITKGAISTCVRFDIPLVLPIPNGAYAVCVGNKRAYVRVVYRDPAAIRAGSQVFGSAVTAPMLAGGFHEWLALPASEHTNKVELLASKRAVSGFTSVLVTFPEYLSPFHYDRDPPQPFDIEEFFANPPPLRTFTTAVQEKLTKMGDRPIPEAAKRAIRLVNRLIDEIRLSGERYNLERITPDDVEAIGVVHLVEGHVWLHISIGYARQAIVGTEFAYEWVDLLRAKLLSNDEPPIERFLLLDARKFLMYGELRLSILNVNAALEAFVHRHFPRRLGTASTSPDVEAFLEGPSLFESCREELIILSATGNRYAGIAAEVMPTPAVDRESRLKPPVNKLVMRMNGHLSFGLSKTKLNRLIGRIRYRRNEVAHGLLGDADLDRDRVRQSIEALEEFIQRAESTAAAGQSQGEEGS